MNDDADLVVFIKNLRQEFPDEAKDTDTLMLERGRNFLDELQYIWIDHFADITNKLIQKREKEKLCKILNWISKQYEDGTDKVKDCIDVGYAENLMWDSAQEDIDWAWPLLPDNIKFLYERMWGNPLAKRK